MQISQVMAAHHHKLNQILIKYNEDISANLYLVSFAAVIRVVT